MINKRKKTIALSIGLFAIGLFVSVFTASAKFNSSGGGGCRVSSNADNNTGYCLKGTGNNLAECRTEGSGNRCSGGNKPDSKPWKSEEVHISDDTN